jgi:hypothetical protein
MIERLELNLTCYRIHEHASELIPARATRDWMEGESAQ